MAVAIPILRIRRANQKLECELSDPKSMQIIGFDKPIKLTEKLKKEILRHYVAILRMTRNEETPNVAHFKRELRVMGRKVWNVLGPIFERFDLNIREVTSLALALDNETVQIPWELALFKSKPCVHLCETINIGRLRVVKSDSWYNPPPRRKRKPRALVVGIDYEDCRKDLGKLDWAEKEAEEIESILRGNGFLVVPLYGKKAKRHKIVKELKRGVDIFHFTGHGRMVRDENKIMAADGDILANEITDVLGEIDAPALSFINACETAIERATVGESIWEAYSWAYALAEQGGRAFVGALWPIYEDEARLFSRRFYEELLGVEKRTLADSTRLARLHAKRTGKAKAIYTWPAYVLYGPPSLLIDDLLR
ncbi:MAG: CHAT domain-containing protein [Candidatus Bathyarchaeota archaeon]|nr:CHAT domain-containing protein [Candidatus Bathyarchaeota archaeon]